MYNIRPRLVNNWSTNESLNDTLDSIDTKVESMACCKAGNIQLDLTCNVDMDLYSDLMMYKEILLNKLLGCKCLEDHKLIDIVSRIKKLTR